MAANHYWTDGKVAYLSLKLRYFQETKFQLYVLEDVHLTEILSSNFP